MESKKRNGFTGSLGFVLAAAGSAVGLGNIWRFPYLAARDGGGLFLVIYFVLVLTFGFTLLTVEIAIGRKTKQSPLTAYAVLAPKWKPLGYIACLVPVLIMPYYCVIGGWVLKYLLAFVTGNGGATAGEDYFTGFLSQVESPIVMSVIFLILTILVVLGGVEKGIEKFSKIAMPALVVLIIIIAIYSLTIEYTDSSGVKRTGLQGLKILIVPDVSNLTVGGFFNTVMDAMGQLFYSLSVAMGIMIAYGSYMRDDTNLGRAITHIEIFDTSMAFLSGMMIIPTVFVFMGKEGMQSGPGLMFEALPNVFLHMGKVGAVVGSLFFALVLIAAITSSVSILEAVVAIMMDGLHVSRRRAIAMESLFALIGAILVSLGYNKLYFNITLPNGASAQLLDVLDYISNNLLMPIVAIATCILVGWVIKPQILIDEVTKNGEKFRRKHLFIVMVKFVAPVLLAILLVESFVHIH